MSEPASPSHGLQHTLLDQLIEGAYFVELHRRITYWNPGAERLTGYPAETVVGRPCSDGVLRHVNDRGHVLCLSGCPLSATMRDGKPREAAVYMHHADGHRLPVTVRAFPLRDDQQQIVGSVELFMTRPGGMFSDLDTNRRNRRHQDPVTGIGTRAYGERILTTALANSTPTEPVGILFLDVDHFKQVNDTYGHQTGDKVLRMVAKTLANALREGDVSVRWGGEEFVAILPGATANDLSSIAERVRMLVEHSWLTLDDHQIRPTVSIGATIATPTDTPTTVIDRADHLMYRAKRTGRNRAASDVGPPGTVLPLLPPPALPSPCAADAACG